MVSLGLYLRPKSESECEHLRTDIAAAQLLELLAHDDFEHAQPIAERILAGGDQTDDDDVLAAAVTTLGVIAWSEGRVADALGLLHAAVRRADRLPAATRQTRARFALARAMVSTGEFDNAHACVEAERREVDASSGIAWTAAPSVVDGRIHLAAGRLDAAAAAAEHGLCVAARLGTHFLTPCAHSTLAVVALRRGEMRAAASHVTMLRAGPPERLGSGAVVCDWVEGLVREAREGPERAVALLGSVYDGEPGSTRLFVEEPGAASWLVRVALRVGEFSSAAAVAGAAARLAAANPSIGPLVAAGHHARGLLDQDADLLQRSAAEYASPWDRAAAQEDAAVALFARSENDGARAALSDAIAAYVRIGAPRDAARARARQRAAGRRRRAPTERATCGWESLTGAELRVAGQVARGLTNRAVAESMNLSRHTIDFHLRRTFRKLGVRSRVQLTRLVLEQQIGGLGRSESRTSDHAIAGCAGSG